MSYAVDRQFPYSSLTQSPATGEEAGGDQGLIQLLPVEIVQNILLFVPESSTSLVCKRWLAFERDSYFSLEKIRRSSKKWGIDRDVAAADALMAKETDANAARRIEIIKRSVMSRCSVEEGTHSLSPMDQKMLVSAASRPLKVLQFWSCFEGWKSLVALWNILLESNLVSDQQLPDVPLREQALLVREGMKKHQNELSKVKSLDLRDKNISKLPPEMALFTSLEDLKLDHNPLHRISAKLLRVWDKIKSFSMANTSLERLPEGFGDNWQQLESLTLSGNDIKTLPAHFSTRWPRLKNIRLENNNIESLSEDFGKFWNSLERATLQNNSYKIVPSSMLELGRRLKVFRYDA
ncbi:F-box/LRR-repeat protein [Estrella lausannensis]|uniref:F-box domain-containing protein n=1 Tax=Estrella lausannensis TaxID=483423 RepID=A0A0H5DPI4_9BACT|nr:leucine-rich repeat domain-containing protein [Estrella lausannensis]CRX38476.1 hypothetical protein ELAC_1133 [Estrella lausannensis]